MSSSPQTMTTANKLLNEMILKKGGLRSILNREASVTFSMLEKQSGDLTNGGRYTRIPIVVEGNYGIAARPDDSDTIDSGYENVQEAVVPLKYVRGGIQLTEAVMRAADVDKNTLKKPLKLEVDGLKASASFYVGRMLFNNGTPQLGLCNGAGSSSTTVTFDNLSGYKILRNGMRYDIWEPAFASKVVDSQVISSLSYNDDGYSGTFAITSETWSDNAIIVIEDTTTGVGVNHEWDGIPNAIGTGTYLGLSGTTYMDWNSPSIDGSAINGGDPTDAHFQSLASKIEKESGNTDSRLCAISTHEVINLYINTQLGLKRYADTTIDGGWAFADFTAGARKMKLVPERYCPQGTVFGLDLEAAGIFRCWDWDWVRGTQDQVLHWVQGTDKYRAQLSYGATFALMQRNRHGKITGLNYAFA